MSFDDDNRTIHELERRRAVKKHEIAEQFRERREREPEAPNNIRRFFQEHPVVSVGVVVTGGFVVSRFLGRGPLKSMGKFALRSAVMQAVPLAIAAFAAEQANGARDEAESAKNEARAANGAARGAHR